MKQWILQCQNILDRIIEDKNHFCLNEKAIISTSLFHQDITIAITILKEQGGNCAYFIFIYSLLLFAHCFIKRLLKRDDKSVFYDKGNQKKGLKKIFYFDIILLYMTYNFCREKGIL